MKIQIGHAISTYIDACKQLNTDRKRLGSLNQNKPVFNQTFYYASEAQSLLDALDDINQAEAALKTSQEKVESTHSNLVKIFDDHFKTATIITEYLGAETRVSLIEDDGVLKILINGKPYL